MGATSNGEQLKREVEREWTKLTFYYGLSFTEIAHMPRWARRVYVKALPRLQAEQQAAAIEAASFSKMTNSARSSVLRKLERDIMGGVVQAALKPKSQDEMAMAAAALGFGVHVVDADGAEVAV